MLIKTSKTEAKHQVNIPPDNGGEISFHWHWPRGTFEPRMSALEIAAFLMPHMPSVLPFFSGHPRVYAEFQAMLVRLASSPTEALDEVLSWIQPVVRTQADDLIVLNIRAKAVLSKAPTTFAGGF